MLELNVFLNMLDDKAFYNLEKMQRKYGKVELSEFLSVLQANLLQRIPLKDFEGNEIVLLESKIKFTSQQKKSLLKSYANPKYGLNAMEDEIISTLSIESIDTNRESVRKILNGGAPQNSSENKAFGIKRGLDFISDTSNIITAENLYKLYMLSVGEFLNDDERLQKGNLYRNDAVYIIGNDVAHVGLNHLRLPLYVSQLIAYINTDDSIDQITKSTIIHYYFAYLHPYFDGNGRMSRLLSLWYLVQKGYSGALYIPFSALIQESKNAYYKAFEQIAANKKVSRILDVTLFVNYFIQNVFAKINATVMTTEVFDSFNNLLQSGIVTVKEAELFKYVLSAYGNHEFSTKQLEKDYGHAAYATIRSFVLKFEKYGLLMSQRYGTRIKYKIN